MRIVIAFLKMAVPAVVVVIMACSEETPLDDAKGKVPAFIARWGCPGHDDGEFYKPYGVAVAPNGDVYVADTYNYRIQYFTPAGSFLGKWDVAPDGWYPKSIAIGPGGVVYVADRFKNRILYFTSGGKLLGSWGSYGGGKGSFVGPEDLVVSSTGVVYVLDFDARIQYFDAKGKYMGEWGSEGGGTGEFWRPEGIAIGRAATCT